LEKFPNLHDIFWKATKTAGDTKKTNDVAVADSLLDQIKEIDRIFWETKKA
jgi:nickel superoxide dismutase